MGTEIGFLVGRLTPFINSVISVEESLLSDKALGGGNWFPTKRENEALFQQMLCIHSHVPKVRK
jgi:hypothetical protein